MIERQLAPMTAKIKNACITRNSDNMFNICVNDHFLVNMGDRDHRIHRISEDDLYDLRDVCNEMIQAIGKESKL